MMTHSLARKAVAVSLAFVSTFQISFAAGGEFLTYEEVQGTVSQSDTTATSGNEIDVLQVSGSGAQQNVNVTGSAATVVTSDQTVNPLTVIDIQQNCAPTDTVCIEHAAPVSVTAALQQVTASSANVVNAAQISGSGSVQNANMNLDAGTDVTATQTVTPQTIVNIFQDCTLITGVCVQRALPEVLTLASQIIAATAMNELNLLQQSSSGAVQNALVDAEANVAVTAEQFVSPRNFLLLAQTCAIDVGLCIQRAIPIIQTAAQQVVNAAAQNNINLAQIATGSGSGSVQNADVDVAANTDVTSTQTVTARNTIVTKQECAVKKGLCLQLDANNMPIYVFSDGETVSSGSYMGTWDDTALDTGVNRQSVSNVAKGICEDGKNCSKLQQLLVWLFGPEAVPQEQQQTVTGNNRPDIAGVSAGHRGHGTNRIAAAIRSITVAFNAEVSPGAFGGDVRSAASDEQLKAVCSVRRALSTTENEVLLAWSAQVLAERIGLSKEVTLSLLENDDLCTPLVTASAQQKVALATPTFFPVDDEGPLSSNALWNKCIRGNEVTLEDIRSNPDTDEAGRPNSCGTYHTGTSWYHPDLDIYFTWNRQSGELEIPEGYIAIVQTATL